VVKVNKYQPIIRVMILLTEEMVINCYNKPLLPLAAEKLRRNVNRYTLMRNIIVIIALLFSGSLFATDSETYGIKKIFIENFSIVESDNSINIKDNFNTSSTFQITIGSTFSGKPDKHFNSVYKVIDIDTNEGNLKIESTKTSDRRSFGGKLMTDTGIFYVTYK
jgi:hypothetical protein